MTETDFASKIARDVKQTFVLTFSRLFDPFLADNREFSYSASPGGSIFTNEKHVAGERSPLRES
jgi:hypothetical protein